MPAKVHAGIYIFTERTIDFFMKQFLPIFIAITLLHASPSFANPTQTGITGLLTVPTADTLDSGNICVGLWGNINKKDDKHAAIMPVALTLGIGSFWEVYGTYPNLLLNGQEDRSGRGTADLGTKLRFWGKRNSTIKLAADVFLQRHISNDTALDGITDIGGRLIASLKTDRIGMHIYGGYLSPGDQPGKAFDKEILYGGGVEFSPSSRTKLTVEIVGSRNRDRTQDDPLEGSIGFQYYLSPHLTFNMAGGVGFSTASPDWRAIVGFSTCQGIGTYIKPVPSLGGTGDKKELKQEVVKPVKIIPITPLMVKSSAPVAPASKLEVPVDPDQEEIIIRPYGQITVPPQPPATPVVIPPVSPPVPSQEAPSKDRLSLKEEVTVSRNEAGVTNTIGEGETPLYAIDVKGDKVEVASAKPSQLSQKMKAIRKFRFPDVMFEYGQMELTDEVKKSLSEVAEQIRNDKTWTYLRIDGHSDGIGSDKYNEDLSLKRAIAVATYLITREGIDPARVFVKGMGKSKLLADNATAEGRKINRRFEILFLVPQE